jgi:hypothetical protein
VIESFEELVSLPRCLAAACWLAGWLAGCAEQRQLLELGSVSCWSWKCQLLELGSVSCWSWAVAAAGGLEGWKTGAGWRQRGSETNSSKLSITDPPLKKFYEEKKQSSRMCDS